MSVALPDLIAPLTQFAGCLGAAAPDWENCEGLERLEWTERPVDRQIAIGIGLEIYRDLWTTFQQALTLEMHVGALPVFQLGANTNAGDIQNLIQDTAAVSSVTCTLRIDKPQLARILYENILAKIPDPKRVYLYLYASRCNQYLRGSRWDGLEQKVWRDEGAPSLVVFLLPGEELFLAGAKFLVLGGSQISTQNIESAKGIASQGDQDRLASAYDRCRANLIWQEAFLKALTPWHLYVEDQLGAPSAIRDTLFTYFVHSFLLYTADGTFFPKGKIGLPLVAHYKSQESDITIPLADPSKNAKLEPEQMKGLKKILDWVYEPEWEAINDRLVLVQLNFVETLASFAEEQRWEGLIARALDIEKNIQWHWKTFLQSRIKTYVAAVKELDNYLEQVVHDLATDIATIQKTLADTLLAGLAVFLGTFLTALFKDPFNDVIFRTGMYLYAGYVALIPLVFGMTAQCFRFRGFEEQIAARRKSFYDCLPEPQVDDKLKLWKISDAITRYRWAYRVTVFLFVVAIGLLILAAIYVPGWVISTLPHTPQPSATPTLTPLPSVTVIATLTATPASTPTLLVPTPTIP